MLLDAHLRVCIEDFDPLGGDEQINLGEALRFSVGTLLQGKNTKTTWCHSLPNQTSQLEVSTVVCLNVSVQLKFMHVVEAVEQVPGLAWWAGCSKGAVRKKEAFLWQLSHYIAARLGMCVASWQGNKTPLDTKLSPAAGFFTTVTSGRAHVSHHCKAHRQNPIGSDYFKQLDKTLQTVSEPWKFMVGEISFYPYETQENILRQKKKS